MSRRVAAAIGTVLAILGLVAVVAPGLASGLPVNRGFVVILAFFLVLGGVRELQRRRTNDRQYAETSDTEESIELPTPGDEFDRRYDRLGMTRYRVGERERLRDEVSEVAVETLVRRKGLSRAEAQRRLEEGDWTSDPYAAAMFTGQPPDVGRTGQLRELFRRGSVFKYRAERAVSELVELVDTDVQGEEFDE